MPFKVGDRVVVRSTSSDWKGKAGKVTKLGARIGVSRGSDTRYFSPKSLAPRTGAGSPASCFSVDDTVRIESPSSPWKGRLGVVVNLPPEGGVSVRLKEGDSGARAFSPANLQRVFDAVHRDDVYTEPIDRSSATAPRGVHRGPEAATGPPAGEPVPDMFDAELAPHQVRRWQWNAVETALCELGKPYQHATDSRRFAFQVGNNMRTLRTAYVNAKHVGIEGRHILENVCWGLLELRFGHGAMLPDGVGRAKVVCWAPGGNKKKKKKQRQDARRSVQGACEDEAKDDDPGLSGAGDVDAGAGAPARQPGKQEPKAAGGGGAQQELKLARVLAFVRAELGLDRAVPGGDKPLEKLRKWGNAAAHPSKTPDERLQLTPSDKPLVAEAAFIAARCFLWYWATYGVLQVGPAGEWLGAKGITPAERAAVARAMLKLEVGVIVQAPDAAARVACALMEGPLSDPDSIVERLREIHSAREATNAKPLGTVVSGAQLTKDVDARNRAS